jgi:hypothetical protein
MDRHDIQTRIERIERRVRHYQIALVIMVLSCVASGAIFSTTTTAQEPNVLRAKGLVIEDAAGRDRIVLGAPLTDPQGRVSPSTGIRINDPQGVERFAVGLLNNDRVVMGFDAPVGKGDPRNRERITIVADADGGGYIRFLNRQTGVPGRLILGDDDKLYLEFLETADGKLRAKRIGFAGETMRDLQ